MKNTNPTVTLAYCRCAKCQLYATKTAQLIDFQSIQGSVDTFLRSHNFKRTWKCVYLFTQKVFRLEDEPDIKCRLKQQKIDISSAPTCSEQPPISHGDKSLECLS